MKVTMELRGRPDFNLELDDLCTSDLILLRGVIDAELDRRVVSEAYLLTRDDDTPERDA